MWPVPAAATNPPVTHECGCARVRRGRKTRGSHTGLPRGHWGGSRRVSNALERAPTTTAPKGDIPSARAGAYLPADTYAARSRSSRSTVLRTALPYAITRSMLWGL